MLIKHPLIIATTLILISINSHAQHYIGIKGGLQWSRILDDSEYNMQDDGYVLPHLGCALNFKLHKNVSFISGADYIQKGDQYKYYTGYNWEVTKTTVKVHFIEVPLIFRLQTSNEGVKPFISGGLGLAIAIGKTHLVPKKELASPSGFRESIKKEIHNRLE